eukprot:gnl/TRDRNA2_/TRDRNA2_42999_c0_seq1.p1 gnl/TRDRNA2_/TRDRNA2_42999_c0~~gnl/TRDRNA2_/TRDRNA2_42999_c0_seq1.p1  ORF type:complete len:655 (-),score=77.11 gnl/TRDRNA2_/TRDRNA2_42999_c0_seq1:124-2088(-)
MQDFHLWQDWLMCVLLLSCATLVASGLEGGHGQLEPNSTCEDQKMKNNFERAIQGNDESLHLLQTRMQSLRLNHTAGSGPCEAWCNGKNKGWAHKCAFKNCMGCAPCKFTDAEKNSSRALTKVEFSRSGEGSEYWTRMWPKQIDPTMEGTPVPVHVVYRPEWQKMLRCVGPSREACEECSGDQNCWSMTKGNANNQTCKTGGSKVFNRFLNLIHVRCAASTITVQLKVVKLVNGNLKVTWDGKRIGPTLWGIDKRGRSFSGTHIIKETIQVNSPGAHDFVLDFVVDGDGEVVIEDLTFFMPKEYAKCEDMKVCLASLGTSPAAKWLRNSNGLQKRCLEKSMRDMQHNEKLACQQWRRCLKKSGGHAPHILSLIEAAGVDPTYQAVQESQWSEVVMCPLNNRWGQICANNDDNHPREYNPADHSWRKRSTDAGNSIEQAQLKCLAMADCNFLSEIHLKNGGGKKFIPAKLCWRLVSAREVVGGRKIHGSRVFIRTSKSVCDAQRKQKTQLEDRVDCIDPRTADPESWDCDCFEEMNKRCQDITERHAVDGFTVPKCLRALFCVDPKVCNDWKKLFCYSEEMETLKELVTPVNAMIEGRSKISTEVPSWKASDNGDLEDLERAGALKLQGRSLGTNLVSKYTESNVDESMVRKSCN